MSGDCPTNWSHASLQRIAAVNPKIDRNGLTDETQICFVPMAAVNEGFGGIREVVKRPYREVKKGYTPFVGGDIIFAKITPCMENGKGGVAEGNSDRFYFGSTEFHVIRMDRRLSPKFVAAFLSQEQLRKDARLKMKGSAGQLRVSTAYMEGIELPIPPAAEQHRIIARLDELFSELDAGVAALERVRRKLPRYRAALLHAAVTGDLTRDWRAAHPAEDGEDADALLRDVLEARRADWERRTREKYEADGKKPPKGWQQRYKGPQPLHTDPLSTLPGSWAWSNQDQVGNVQLGRQRSPKHQTGDHIRPYLRVANVHDDEIRTDDVLEMNFTPKEFLTYQLRAGDILLNEGQSMELIGRPAMYRDDVPGCCFQNTLVRQRVLPLINEDFAYLVVRAQYKTGRYQAIASITTSIAHLGAERFAGVEFPLPPAAEQQEIVNRTAEKLSQIDAMQTEVDRGLRRAERLRQSILKAAFEGRLVPQDPADEPASALLARIAADRAAS